ncbi:hypothetical protein NPM_1815 [Nostoc sp. 'Peltigera membranacea cyanobiont' N6]|nr:hypothetical protein NPM_1815 [Nostoc sp. 'Peltigera membranacea cyanobiont' N6]
MIGGCYQILCCSWLLYLAIKQCINTHLVGIKSTQCADNSIPPNINLLVSTESGEPIENAKVEFIGIDNPEPRYTDNSGFVAARIKNEGFIIVRVRAKNYPTQNTTINVNTQQVTTREIRLSQSGTPAVKDLNPTPTPIPIPTPTPTPTATTPVSTNPAPAVLPLTEVWGSVAFQLDSCTRKKGNIVSCHFSLISTQDVNFNVSLANDTRIVDGSNNPYYVNKGYSGKLAAGFNNNLPLNMVKDAHSNVIIDFAGVPDSVSQAFLLNLTLVGRGNLEFRNIPIQ